MSCAAHVIPVTAFSEEFTEQENILSPPTPPADRFVVFGSASLTKTTKHSIRLSFLLRSVPPCPPRPIRSGGRRA